MQTVFGGDVLSLRTEMLVPTREYEQQSRSLDPILSHARVESQVPTAKAASKGIKI